MFRPTRVELTDYQRAFIWMKMHNAEHDIKRSENGKIVLVRTNKGEAQGATLPEAVTNYVGRYKKSA